MIARMEDGMNKTQATIPAGTIVTMTTGEYSDYSIIGAFRAVRDITHDDIERVKREIEERPNRDEMYGYELYTAFIAVLVASGFLEDTPSAEIYLGDYGRIEPSVSFTEDEE